MPIRLSVCWWDQEAENSINKLLLRPIQSTKEENINNLRLPKTELVAAVKDPRLTSRDYLCNNCRQKLTKIQAVYRKQKMVKFEQSRTEWGTDYIYIWICKLITCRSRCQSRTNQWHSSQPGCVTSGSIKRYNCFYFVCFIRNICKMWLRAGNIGVVVVNKFMLRSFYCASSAGMPYPRGTEDSYCFPCFVYSVPEMFNYQVDTSVSPVLWFYADPSQSVHLIYFQIQKFIRLF